MKKLIKGIFLLVTICLAACSGKKSDLIIGKWNFDGGEITPKEDINGMLKEQMQAQVKAMKEAGYSWSFDKNGSYAAVVNGTTYTGKWMLTPDGDNMIYTADPDGKSDTCKVVELSEKKFVFTQEGETSTSVSTFVKP